MIWYLLYPFRGTTEPPSLAPNHPLRIAFTRYGNYAARHPVFTLLISVTAATILIYPFPFLYTNSFTNGASNLPHHVWTSAQPFEGDLNTQADVVMRSIWVHGSYMKALQSDVLQTALEIQDEILGSTFNFDPRRPGNDSDSIQFEGDTSSTMTPDIRDTLHAVNGLSNFSWFFHSPLQYWSCSSQRIADDEDIIATVNSHKHQATSVNVTLRHSIIFSGKRFEDHRLVAADALVITLVHMLDSPVGLLWQKKAEEIASRNSERWRVYPADGRSLASTLYEFRFQPISLQDDVLLGLAYTLTTVYFVISLSKLKALKSRLGLIIAVASQIAVSIMSSFTVCAIFKIDLSRIPREAYPLVVLTVGLENVFRLINTVIMTSPDRPTAARMGEALGLTAHVALASAAQNLLILWILSRVVSPGVAAFCSFAAIALTFDFFYLITFFIAVLSVDVRRTELGDWLTRVSTRSQRLSTAESKQIQSWSDAILRGEAPISTRIAGTVVLIAFVAAAQWHFFEKESIFQTFLRLTRLFRADKHISQPSQRSLSLLSVDINQARTPTAWLRLQDHETAREVIKVIKPKANSYIASVYDPLIFVLNGSDRTPTKFGIQHFSPAVYDFVKHQQASFIFTVIFTLAVVTLLMNYLLWDVSQEDEEDERPEDDPLLSVRTLSKGHALDIVLLSATSDGVVATVGLDRWIRIWDVRSEGNSYTVNNSESNIDPFPVLAMAIDSSSNWLALLSFKDQVFLWNIVERRWGPSMPVEVKGRAPVAFCFGYDAFALVNPVLIVRQNGLMTELDMETYQSIHTQICRSPLLIAGPYLEKAGPNCPPVPFRIITASKRGCVHIATRLDEGWISQGIEIPCPDDNMEIFAVVPLPALSSFLAVRKHNVDLIDIITHKVTHTFNTRELKPGSLRCFHSTRRRPQCGSVGLASLALAYDNAETGDLTLQTYVPQQEGHTICFRDPYTPGSATCCLWRDTVEQVHTIPNPGNWKALQVGFIVGVRKQQIPNPAASFNHHPQLDLGSGLRRRGRNEKNSQGSRRPTEDRWEVWTISARGERNSMPLCRYDENANSIQDHLLVSNLGPLDKVGKRSIAVSLGNMVKVITIGTERYDEDYSVNDESVFAMASRRRKKKSVN